MCSSNSAETVEGISLKLLSEHHSLKIRWCSECCGIILDHCRRHRLTLGNYKTTHIGGLYKSLNLHEVPFQYQGLLYGRLHDKVRRELDKLRKDGQVPQWRTSTGVWKAQWPEPTEAPGTDDVVGQGADANVSATASPTRLDVPVADITRANENTSGTTSGAEVRSDEVSLLDAIIQAARDAARRPSAAGVGTSPPPILHHETSVTASPPPMDIPVTENTSSTTSDTGSRKGPSELHSQDSRLQAIRDAAARRFIANKDLVALQREALLSRLVLLQDVKEGRSKVTQPGYTSPQHEQAWRDATQRLADAEKSFYNGLRALSK